VHAVSRPLVDLVIVNYRSYEELTRCLASLEPSRAILNRVTIVDHESDLAAAARVSSRFPWVTMLERTTNEGFATGVNLGVRGSSAPFLLLLNPDCVAGGEAIAGLVTFAESRPDAAVIGPRILNADGSVQGSARRFPGLSTFVAGRSSWLTRTFPNNPLSRWNLPGRAESGGTISVDWLSGACMLIRRAAFEQVGGMDERFFLYWEDADFCRRLSQRGWRIVYFPAVSVTHVGGRSSIHAYRESLAAFHASAYILFRKHASWTLQALAPLVYLVLQARLRALLYIHRNRLTSSTLPASEGTSRV
jgi:GT2 family glycosyltransferase